MSLQRSQIIDTAKLGFDKLKQINPKLIKPALFIAAGRVKEIANQEEPMTPFDTGTLRDNWNLDQERAGRKETSVMIDNDSPYANYQETKKKTEESKYKTEGTGPGYLGKVLDDHAADVQEVFINELETAIQDEFK